jgi:RNA polymerase sigma-70 factor (ECF subfamily)
MPIVTSLPPQVPAPGLYRGATSEYVDHGEQSRLDRRHRIFEPYSVSLTSTSSAEASDDDLSLVVAMARGEERAATQLYDRHGAVMYGLALRMVSEPADAEEVVLDAFAQAWREASRYDTSRGSVLGWLTTIVRSRALDAIRARGRRTKMVESAAVRLDEPAAMGESAPAPDRAVEDSERAVAIDSALRSLPDPQRRAIELAFFEGLTHQEVAERLREPLGTVKTRIRLGMLKLRDLLGGLAPEPAS